MAARVGVSYPEFKEKILDTIAEYQARALKDKSDERVQTKKDYCIAVGEAAMAFKERRWGGNVQKLDEEWRAWLFEFKDALNEDWDTVCEISKTKIEDLKKSGGGDVRNAYALHYCLHTEFDRPQFAKEIDEKVFGGRFEDVFHKAVFEDGTVTAALVDWKSRNEEQGRQTQQSTALKQNFTEKHQPVAASVPSVGRPRHIGQIYHYTNHFIDTLGREAQCKALERFRDAGTGFRWWQIAGVAGQGKSRLALDFLANIDDNWHAGFFLTDDDDQALKQFAEASPNWTPDKNCFFIVDYVLTRKKHLRKIIRNLGERQETFQFAVCLLLVERQPWNSTGDDSSGNYRAGWFAQLSESGSGSETDLTNLAFDDAVYGQVMNLTALAPSDLCKIVTIVCKQGSSPLLLDDTQVETLLAAIDDQGRPLYAYFLGKALGEGEIKATASATALLDWVLRSDRLRRWSSAEFENSPLAPDIGSFSPNLSNYAGQNPSMHMAVLSSIIREIDCNTLAQSYGELGWAPHNSRILREAQIISDNHISISPEPKIFGLEPDLLGEYFALESIRRQHLFLSVLDLAWKLRPDQTAEFLTRITRDFPRHEATALILNHTPAGTLTAAKQSYANVAATMLVNLHQAGVRFPEGPIAMLSDDCRENRASTSTFLGVCYAHGAGVAQDWRVAVEWFHKGAKAGSVLSMSSLALCYTHGVGTEQNSEIAEDWKLSAAAQICDDVPEPFDEISFFLGQLAPISDGRVHSASLILNLGEDWLDVPPLHGDWHDVGDINAVIRKVVMSAFIERQSAALDFKSVTAARECEVAFYPGYRLVDLQLKDAIYGVYFFTTALVSESHTLLLDGEMRYLDLFNQKALLINSAEKAVGYLCFYCEFVRGNKNPFHIVTSTDDLQFDNTVSKETFDSVFPRILEPVHVHYAEREGVYICETHVLFGNSLYAVTFMVHPKGEVSLIKEDLLAGGLSIQQRVFEGIIRTPPLNLERR